MVDPLRQGIYQLDPKTSVTKVPKIVHFVLLGDPPGFMIKVTEYSTKAIESHGFKVMIHRDDDGEELIRNHYPTLLRPWELLKAIPHADKAARMVDFLRVIVLYHYGGIYLDSDMVTCGDLSELTNTPGIVSFPVVEWKNNKVINAVMAGPPQHLLFKTAIAMRYKNEEDLVNEHIFVATGSV
eukprot:CAMPEP_0172521652 /NCGR_PEP_ID=MMETSP1066-20121228/292703_1 /TAXON_ID=671091 /ORGANISM="Coscinodiscus wailesii, Strain CCMP2513" /LENGTH=182 /DNA_ID=CAMNT_0013304597 /DNA_START=218 /DNA_END=765 /DNA_ORIENTATION=-